MSDGLYSAVAKHWFRTQTNWLDVDTIRVNYLMVKQYQAITHRVWGLTSQRHRSGLGSAGWSGGGQLVGLVLTLGSALVLPRLPAQTPLIRRQLGGQMWPLVGTVAWVAAGLVAVISVYGNPIDSTTTVENGPIAIRAQNGLSWPLSPTATVRSIHEASPT